MLTKIKGRSKVVFFPPPLGIGSAGAMSSIEELRAQARRLGQAANTISDPQTKQELAARALELSQRAEALERAIADPWTLRANIDRYRSLLASRTLNDDQKRIVEELLADAEHLLGDFKNAADDP